LASSRHCHCYKRLDDASHERKRERIAIFQIMKTMLEILIRLHEMRCCCERIRRNPHLTNREKAVACSHKQIVRECLPPEVLTHYDRMKKSERALRSYPEVFAMAVLVSAFRSLSPNGRKKLAAHFALPSKQQGSDPGGKFANRRARHAVAVQGRE
jgi:hypothetical protein